MSRVSSIVESFANTYPYVPKMVELEPATEGVHGGVSIANGNAAGGLQIFMLAYLGQARNDELRLVLNGTELPDPTIVEAGKENEDTTLYLDAGLLQKGPNQIKISVKRTSGNNDSTQELVLLYRTSPPGDTPAVLSLSVSHSQIDAENADDVSVTVTYKNINWYDSIYVDCNGARVTYRLLPDTLPPPATVPKEIMIPIPRSKLEQGGDDSDFEFKFRVVDHVSNPSGPPTWSDIVTVDVDLTRLTLPAPFLVNPVVNPIDPLAYENGVTVRVQYSDGNTGNQAQLEVTPTLPDTAPFPVLTFNTNNRVNFKLTTAFLLARLGSAFSLKWILIREGKPAGTSPALELFIKPIAENDPRLPTPDIAGETGEVLETLKLAPDARILSARVPLQKAGLPLWVSLEGVDQNGNPITLNVRNGELNESADGYSLEAPIEWLRALKDGSPLTIVGFMGLGGNSDKTKAVPLPVRSYTIKTAGVENFEQLHIDGTHHRLELPTMLITAPTPGSPGFSIRYFEPAIPGKLEGHVLIVYGRDNLIDVINFELKTTCSEISFWILNIVFPGGYYSTYDNDGKLLQRQNLLVTGTIGNPGTQECKSTAANIKKLQITTPNNNGFFLDNISWR